MSRRILIVDGHSVIFASKHLRALHSRKNARARDELIRALTEYQDFSGIQVVAVFDGAGPRVSDATEEGGIQIFYSSKSKTADDVIERLVAAYATRAEITVATSDLMEQQTVISFGGNCMSVEQLEELLEQSRKDFHRDTKRYFRKD